MWDPRNASKDVGHLSVQSRCYICSRSASDTFDWRSFAHGNVENNQPPYHWPLCTRHKCTHLGCKQPRELPDRKDRWTCSKHSGSLGSQLAVASQPAVISQPAVTPQPVVASQPQPRKPREGCTLCYNGDYVHDTLNPAEKNLSLCTRHRCTVPGCEAPRANRHLPGNGRQSTYMFAKQHALNEDWWCTTHIQSAALPDDGRAKLGTVEVNATPKAVLKAEPRPSAEGDSWYDAVSEQETVPAKRHSRIRSFFKFVVPSKGRGRESIPNEKKTPTQQNSEPPSFGTAPTAPGNLSNTTKPPTSVVLSKAATPADEAPPQDMKEIKDTTETDNSNSKTNPKSVLVQDKSSTSPESVIQAEVERVGWHQCHAPACQARVISEAVWVCHKHLEQGYYDQDDPPGFMENPGLGK